MESNIFKHIVNIRFADTDKYGHVNNCTYFNYFEEARTTWAYENTELMSWATQNSIQLVITEQTCKYILPLLHPNRIEVTQYISKIGAVSLEFKYEIRLVGDEQIITKANAKLACYNSKTHRLQKIPSELKKMILEKNDRNK
ncbi:acyl-ACP thioesterase family protein [Francisella philomiragia]|uniref:acyl-CoA thioesterase n=1 Tax=Francisella philomiragia TaxID=28110 RepID=UPI0005A56366|nr:thioesterase family protein [Francisella philomiragia]AJI56773.1 acyl-ACP thioesterase family protein [Francisella philomiragia]MBK2025119.1 acyl-CoA thioesterase [Francisella philomiragia]MBK2106661.1 acyl-CoA thioesterase [Francisella philomiragia]